MHEYYVTKIYTYSDSEQKKTLLTLKLMVVFDVLLINDSIYFGAVAVNDLTHPKKTLSDKALVFVYTPYVFGDKT